MKSTKKVSGRKYSGIGSFFCRLGGADMSILGQVPTERGKLMSIGVGVFNTALTATVAMGFALYSIFNPNDAVDFGWMSVLAVVVISIFWGWLILGIDWGLVKSLKRKRNNWREFSFYVAILMRFGLAFVIARFVAIPMELQFFANRTKVQKQELRIAKRDSLVSQYFAGLQKELYQDSIDVRVAEDERNTKFELKNNSDRPQSIMSTEDLIGKNAAALSVIQGQLNIAIGRRRAILNDPNNYTSYELPSEHLKNAEKAQLLHSNIIPDYFTVQAQINSLVGEKNRLKSENTSKTTFVENETDTYRTQVTKQYLDAQRKYEYLDSLYKVKKDNYEEKRIELRQQAEIDAARSIGNDIISNIEAMESYLNTEEGEGSRIWQWLIRTLFIIVDIMPILLKILFPYGPYDRRLETTDIQEINLVEQELGLNIDLMAKMAMTQREIINNEEGRIKVKLERDFDDLLKNQSI